MTSIPLLSIPVTRPARRNAWGAFSCPTPCAPALEGTPMSPILLNILHLDFFFKGIYLSPGKPIGEFPCPEEEYSR
jgi:hypothetical protein